RPHSAFENAAKVTLPTSSATGSSSEGARNLTGVARKETPTSIPSHASATNAVTASGNGAVDREAIAIPSGSHPGSGKAEEHRELQALRDAFRALDEHGSDF